MTILPRALLTMAAVAGLVSTASAADLAYKVKAPVYAAPAYSWTGFYGGIEGGGALADPGNLSFNADPAAGQTVVVGPAANGSAPIYSQAYNNLANGGVGQVSNLINPTGLNCLGLVNCNVGGAVNTSILPNTNPGFRTDSTVPSSLNGSQLSGLIGLDIGARKQFDNNVVLGITADIMAFTHGGTTNYNSSGSFFNTNGFTGNSAATACIDVFVLGTCQQVQTLTASGNVATVNSGGSTSNFQIAANPNWIGTVRGSLGYAFDRLLIFGTAGLAYSDGGMSVKGSYNDRVSSACTGVSNTLASAANGAGQPGFAQVNFSCGGTALNSASVAQVTTTAITYSGSHAGILTGFAAGGGMAYAVSDHVSLTLEGMYYNLGTERVTVTGTGTQTTTTTTTPIIVNGVGGAPTAVTATGAATASNFTVSKMIDGALFKGGIQFKF